MTEVGDQVVVYTHGWNEGKEKNDERQQRERDIRGGEMKARGRRR